MKRVFKYLFWICLCQRLIKTTLNTVNKTFQKIVHKMVHISKLTQLNLSLCLNLASIWSIFITQICWMLFLRSIKLIKSRLVTFRTRTTFQEFFCQEFLGLPWLVTICICHSKIRYWSQTKFTFSGLTAILSHTIFCPSGHLMYRYRNFCHERPGLCQEVVSKVGGSRSVSLSIAEV